MFAVLRLRDLQIFVERADIAVFIASGSLGGNRRPRDVVFLERRHELALFAVEQHLRVDRFVVGFLDLPEGVVEHTLIGRARVHQEGAQVEGSDARAGVEEAFLVCAALVREIERSA